MSSVERRIRNGRTRWLARWRDESGRQRSRSFERKLDASNFLAHVTVAIASGDYVDPRSGRITFGAYFQQYAARQVWRPGTERAMSLAAGGSPFWSIAIARITPSMVQSWVREMSQSLAPGTVRTRLHNVRQVFRAAVRDRVIRFDPSEGVSLPSVTPLRARMSLLGPADAVRLLEASEGPLRPFVGLGLFAGLRLGEAAGLQVGDVDFLRRQIRVRRQVQRVPGGIDVTQPKSASSVRDIPAPDALLEMLAEHIRVTGRDQHDDFLFTTTNGRPVDQNTIGNLFRRARRRAGLPELRFHDLRHTYASGLIAAGLDVVKVQRALGHASASVTLGTYAHLWPDAEDVTRAAAGALAAHLLATPQHCEIPIDQPARVLPV